MIKTLITLVLFSSITIYGQDLFTKSIITEGKASISIKPEIVAFYIDFETKDFYYDACTEKALSSINDFKNKLKGAGVDENKLKTLSFSIQKESSYNQSTKQNDFVGYETSVRLLIKLNYNNKGIDSVYEILRDNLKSKYSINFELNDEQIESVKKSLIEMAIVDATNKAQIIASNTGVSLGHTLKVQYGDPQVISNFINPGFELLFKGSGRTSYATGSSSRVMNSLNPQDIELKTNIVVGWEITQNN